MSCSHAARLQKEYGLFGKLQQKPWTDLEELFFYLHNFLEEVGNKLTALLKLRWPLGRAWMGRFYNFLYNCVVIRTMELSLLSSQITLIHQTKRLRAKCTTYL